MITSIFMLTYGVIMGGVGYITKNTAYMVIGHVWLVGALLYAYLYQILERIPPL